MEIKGFFVVSVDGRYYQSNGEYTLIKDDAYAFMLKHLAERLANRLGGYVERV
jgi:hypothetical protein